MRSLELGNEWPETILVEGYKVPGVDHFNILKDPRLFDFVQHILDNEFVSI